MIRFGGGSASLLLAAALLAASPAPAAGETRTVGCNEQVRSPKRGLCANALSAEDLAAVAGGVSWWYNWHFEVGDSAPPKAPVSHLPMVWGGHPESLAGLRTVLATGARPKFVLALNEPNLKGQAFMPPREAAEAYRAIVREAAPYAIDVVGPHMAIGSAPESSVTAFDPIERRDMTYTYMMPYLAAFYHFAGKMDAPRIGVHAYGNIGELGWVIGLLEKELGKLIWVTEFSWAQAPDGEALIDYLVKAVDLMERTPAVEGYAWFKERMREGKSGVLAKEPGKLTPLGEVYVRMPVHDPDIYYRVPGRLEAERYASGKGQDVRRTTDAEGFLDVVVGETGGWLDYNVDVPRAGPCDLALRGRGKSGGKCEVRRGGDRLAVLDLPKGEWDEVRGRVVLAAGRQVLRLRFGKPAELNWLAVTGPRPEP